MERRAPLTSPCTVETTSPLHSSPTSTELPAQPSPAFWLRTPQRTDVSPHILHSSPAFRPQTPQRTDVSTHLLRSSPAFRQRTPKLTDGTTQPLLSPFASPELSAQSSPASRLHTPQRTDEMTHPLFSSPATPEPPAQPSPVFRPRTPQLADGTTPPLLSPFASPELSAQSSPASRQNTPPQRTDGTTPPIRPSLVTPEPPSQPSPAFRLQTPQHNVETTLPLLSPLTSPELSAQQSPTSRLHTPPQRAEGTTPPLHPSPATPEPRDQPSPAFRLQTPQLDDQTTPHRRPSATDPPTPLWSPPVSPERPSPLAGRRFNFCSPLAPFADTLPPSPLGSPPSSLDSSSCSLDSLTYLFDSMPSSLDSQPSPLSYFAAPNTDFADAAGTSRRRQPPRRKNFCPFCQNMFSNFSRHLVAKHGDEEPIVEYVALSSESPRKRRTRRTHITDRLRKLGNDMYNRQIADGRRHGTLLPAKRSSRDRRAVTSLTHVACKHCAGFMRRDAMYRHLARCIQNATRPPGGPKKTRVLAGHAERLLGANESATRQLREEVFPRMQMDEETAVAQSDELISKYGAHMRFTHRGPKQVYYCSSRMRSLARLLLTMKEIVPAIERFRECVEPKHFKALAESVRRMSGFDPTDGATRVPSVPPRLCSSLKRCANIVKSDAIQHATMSRQEKTEVMSRMDEFLHLMEREWAMEVGANSESSRKRSRVTKQDLLPDPDDIRAFSQYIHERCLAYTAMLKSVPTVTVYETLAKLVIAHIITLNRRRPNETVEVTLDAYRSTLNKRTEYGHGAQNTMTEEELRSADQLSIFYIAANKNLKKVPILLTKTFQAAVDALIEARDKIGVTSKYLFGRVGDNELFDGTVVMRELARKADLRDPAALTANALRHHAATSSQLHARDDTFTKRLSKFMGHDLSTHEHYYEMPLPLVQKTVVGHRLLEMIQPRSTALASHTATSGSLSPGATAITTTNDGFCEAACSREMLGPTKASDSGVRQEGENYTATITRPGPPTDAAAAPLGIQRLAPKPRASADADLPWTPSGSTDGLESEREEDDRAADRDRPPPKKKHPKRRWSDAERNTLYERFAQHFIRDVPPPRSEIRTLWEEEALLKNRTLQQVVTYVNNITTKKQSIATPTRRKMRRMLAKGEKKLSP